MASPQVSAALTANELTVLGGLAYPYAPSSSVAGQGVYFADTTGGRLVGTAGILGNAAGVNQAVTNQLSGQGATVTLTANQSGMYVYFDRAAGIAYTLPAAAAGLTFTFIVTVSVTSNAHSITTAASGSQFIAGAIQLTKAAASPSSFLANGSSNYLISMNGTTTGGLIGTVIEYYGMSSTLWVVNANIIGSGTLATPIT